MWLHYTWISTPTRVQILKDFYAFLSNYPNVFFATPKQVLAWMKNPVPASQVHLMPEFACPSLRPATASPEVCNGIDDDLNGIVDDGTGAPNFCMFTEGSFYSCTSCPRGYPALSGVIPLEPGWTGYANVSIENYGSSFCGSVTFYNPENLTSITWVITFNMNGVTALNNQWGSVIINYPHSEYPNQYTITPASYNAQINGLKYDSEPGFCGQGSNVQVDPSSVTIRFT